MRWALWWALAPAVATPPDQDEVAIERGPTRWRATVNGRTVDVPVPQTDEDHAIFRALVTSLLLDLQYRARPPEVPAVQPIPSTANPPPRAPRAAPSEPAPPPPPDPSPAAKTEPTAKTDQSAAQSTRPAPLAPASPPARAPSAPTPTAKTLPAALVEPAPRRAAFPRVAWQLWVAGEVALHPVVAPGPGGSVGLNLGRRSGAGLRLGLRLPRNAGFGPDLTTRQLEADALAWTRAGPLRLTAAAGVVSRRYDLGAQVHARQPVPVASGLVGLPVSAGALVVEPTVALATDVAVTRIGPPGDKEVLTPVSVRIELRIGAFGEPDPDVRTSVSTAPRED
ncbi:MAG: hypothetical protein KTR31_30500 [Myxococcales bacterium]|nr:hypothetical protein [Myxococcales bacterium]